VDLQGADLQGADLREAKLETADLREAKLEQAAADENTACRMASIGGLLASGWSQRNLHDCCSSVRCRQAR
jgi:uncharacterized protein YjbI with pentapeptide repeats